MELDDIKKEYIRIREELESSKKSLEVINKKIYGLEKDLKIKELKLEIAKLENDSVAISEIEKEIADDKNAIREIKSIATRDKEKFEQKYANLTAKMKSLDMDPYNKGKLDMMLQIRKIGKLENKETKMKNIQKAVLSNEGLKANIEKMVVLYPFVLKYTQELNKPNVDKSKVEHLKKELYNVQEKFYINQLQVSEYIDKNNLDIKLSDLEDLMVENPKIENNNVDLNDLFNRVFEKINVEKDAITREDRKLDEIAYKEHLYQKIVNEQKGKEDTNKSGTEKGEPSDMDESELKNKDSKDDIEDDFEEVDLDEFDKFEDSEMEDDKDLEDNIEDDFEEVDLDEFETTPEQQAKTRQKITKAMRVYDPKEDNFFKKILNGIKNIVDKFIINPIKQKKLEAYYDKQRQEKKAAKQKQVEELQLKEKRDKNKNNFRDQLVANHKLENDMDEVKARNKINHVSKDDHDLER